MTDHHSSRIARAKSKDRTRQQKRRNKLRASGAPTTHVLNRALAEGLMYQIDVQRARGVQTREIRVSVQHVLAYATAILTAGTNGTDRYACDAVVTAISNRIGQPDSKKFRASSLGKDQAWVAGLLGTDFTDDGE
jgi:hypothetical protein